MTLVSRFQPLTVAVDPHRIGWPHRIFTTRNRAGISETGPKALSRFMNSLATTITEDTPVWDLFLKGHEEPTNLDTIRAEIAVMLVPFIRGTMPILNAEKLSSAFRDHPVDLSDAPASERRDFWHYGRHPGLWDQRHPNNEAELVRLMCDGLFPLFRVDSVEHCLPTLDRNYAPDAPMICAGLLELIEWWIMVPTTPPATAVGRVVTNDQLSQDFLRTVAGRIQLPFVGAINALDSERRDILGAILRKWIKMFALYSSSARTGCSNAMSSVIDRCLYDINIPTPLHHTESVRWVPFVLALQIIFLAFHKASMLIPEECRMPQRTEALAKEHFPALRKHFGAIIVPEIIA